MGHIAHERLDASHPLTNARQESFCQNIRAGMTQRSAYVKAGYCDNTSAAQTAYKLTKKTPVATRIEYLKKAVADVAIAENITTLREVWETGQRIIDQP